MRKATPAFRAGTHLATQLREDRFLDNGRFGNLLEHTHRARAHVRRAPAGEECSGGNMDAHSKRLAPVGRERAARTHHATPNFPLPSSLSRSKSASSTAALSINSCESGYTDARRASSKSATAAPLPLAGDPDPNMSAKRYNTWPVSAKRPSNYYAERIVEANAGDLGSKGRVDA